MVNCIPHLKIYLFKNKFNIYIIITRTKILNNYILEFTTKLLFYTRNE